MSFGPQFPPSGDELRDGLYRLFQRSYERAAPQGQGAAVYRSSFEILGRLCAEPWAWRTIFPNETALTRRFLTESGLPVERATLAKSLLVHSAAAAWRGLLQGLEREAFGALCEVRGAEHLAAAQARGRGVLFAHCHALFAPLFWTWLDHQGLARGVTIGHWAWDRARASAERNDPRRRVLETARELHAASASLRAGGFAHVFGDGVQGTRRVELEFCGRRRAFISTFAELAAATGATTLTAAVSLGADGRIAIEVGAPLPPGTPEEMVRAYAEWLGRRWRADPAQLPRQDMQSHLKFPAL